MPGQEGGQLSIVAANRSSVQIQVDERKSRPWIALVAILLLVSAYGIFRFFMLRKPVLSERDTVVLADFANSTSDSVFDGTLRQGM